MKYLVFGLILIMFEFAVFSAITGAIKSAILPFVIAIIGYVIWIATIRIKPYRTEGRGASHNRFFNRRSLRIKFDVSLLIFFLVLVQLDIGFHIAGKPWAGDIGFSWVTGIAVLIILVGLYRDIASKGQTGNGSDDSFGSAD